MSELNSGTEVIASRFQGWIESRPADATDPLLADALIDASATFSDVARMRLRPGSFLFLPEAVDEKIASATEATAIRYSGELAPSGSDVRVGERLLVQFESYSTVEYLLLACPTAVSIVDDLDLQVLRSDAERARIEGVFPAHLINPLVTFVGLFELLAWGAASHLPRSRHLSGSVLAELDDLDGRGLRRYLAALRALHLAAPRLSAPISVSGFGPPFFAGQSNDADSNAPFVLKTSDSRFYVSDPRCRLFGEVPCAIAEIVECVIAGQDPPADVLAAASISVWTPTVAAVIFRKLGLEPLPNLGHDAFA